MSRSETACAPRPASPTRTVRLSGPSTALDHRVNAFRPDLADLALAGRVVAASYAEPRLMRCTADSAMMRSRAAADAAAVSELLFGEDFAVLERGGEWAWGYSARDRYVGYVPATALRADAPEPTHRVTAPSALLFSAADIKSPLRRTLPMGAGVAVVGGDDKFALLADGSFVHRRHIAPPAGDAASLAWQFVGTPYLWGGRTRGGLDCSGLVQIVLQTTGTECPRDADQQRALGTEVALADARRSDLVFFPGHVGIMQDSDRLLHANAFWMTTVIEPLADVVARGSEILAVRRL